MKSAILGFPTFVPASVLQNRTDRKTKKTKRTKRTRRHED